MQRHWLRHTRMLFIYLSKRKIPLRLPIFETRSALISLKKVDRKTLPTAALQSVPIVRRRNHPHTLQRTIISLALVAMFIIPLSLGFLVGRDKVEVSPAFSASVCFSSSQGCSSCIYTTLQLQCLPFVSGKTISTTCNAFCSSSQA